MRVTCIGDCKKELPVWLLSLLVFGCIFVGFGVGLYPDSDTYIQMMEKREPLYPFLLQIHRNLFGEYGLKMVTGMQNFLAACSVAYFTNLIRRIFLEKYRTVVKRVATFGIWCIALMPHVMTPLGSASHMIISNAILTEGLTYPLYLFFVAELIRGLFEKEAAGRSAMIRALGVSELMMLMRNQLVTTLIAWCVVAFYLVMRRKERWKGKLARVCLIVVGILLAFFINRTVSNLYYNHYCDGYSGEKLGNVGFLANVLYLADGTERDIIERSELRSAYEEMLAGRADQKLEAIREGKLLERALHYEDCYDPLKYDVIEPILEERLYQNGVEGREVNQQVYEQCGEMFQSLLPEMMPQYFILSMCNFALGLIRTVSLPHGIFVWIGVLLYLGLVGLWVWNTVHHIGERENLVILLAIGMTILHTGATAVVIMCLSRYVIYNTTLIYGAGFLALCNLLFGKEKENGI